MTSPYRIERERGTKEARQQLVVLREMAARISGRALGRGAPLTKDETRILSWSDAATVRLRRRDRFEVRAADEG
jgi:hypothetical protein